MIQSRLTLAPDRRERTEQGNRPFARPAPRATRLLALTLFLLTIGQVHARPSPFPRQDHPGARLPGVSAQPHPAVCRIVVPERDGISYGSGTLVAVLGEYGLVMTNWHVVRDATDVVTVIFPDRFQSGARLIRSDGDWDLAALVIWRPHAEPVPIAAAPPRQGDMLTIAGYGSGTYRAATGRCTQYVSPGVHLPFEMVEVSVEARQGDSGGPIFNDQGELAGVLFGASHGTTSGSYAGRVGWFLTQISPHLVQPNPTQVAGVAPDGPPHLQSVPEADTGLGPAVVNVPPLVQSPRVEHRVMERPDGSEARGVKVTWQEIAGETPLEWVKTVLAAFGMLAIVTRLMRWMG